MLTRLPRYAVIEKAVGETPLQALERYRSSAGIATEVTLAYAGRLDPMASGTLLILIGDECKRQSEYHGLDKAYIFTILFGVGSDTYDPLGRLTPAQPRDITAAKLNAILPQFRGAISLPYPPFSAKTVQGKPLHTWTLEGRLNEIEIPKQHSTVYRLSLKNIYTKTGAELTDDAAAKIQTVTPVNDPRKALGADFRRTDVLLDWQRVTKQHHDTEFVLADFYCVASSGTYMRSLAHHIGTTLDTPALAWSIHRETIGRYQTIFGQWGFFSRRFR